MKSRGSGTFAGSNIASSDQNVALRDHLRIASRDVKRNIQNRWSGNGIGIARGESPTSTSAASYSADERQGLLSGAAEPPFDSPLAQARSHKQQPSMMSVSTSTDNPNINILPEEYPSNVASSSAFYSRNQHGPNVETSMNSSYCSSATANNDAAAPPPSYSSAYAVSSQRPMAQHPISSTVNAHMYVNAYANAQEQHTNPNMDTPSTSQLQRTINRTLLGGNESTMLSEQHQQHPGFFSSGGRETTIC